MDHNRVILYGKLAKYFIAGGTVFICWAMVTAMVEEKYWAAAIDCVCAAINTVNFHKLHSWAR